MFTKSSLASSCHNLFKNLVVFENISRGKKTIDKSLVPNLNETDLVERFVKGGGPGGSKVNKATNAVFLLHKPTGLHLKVHEHRELFQNRKLARERLQLMLDNLINKENSIENQKKALLAEKSKKTAQKQKKLKEMKDKWKELNQKS